MKAFPIIDFENSEDGYIYFDQGMNLRDYFAAKAMQGFLTESGDLVFDGLAIDSYRVADEMMRAREK
jgi:hypothetical protein